MDARLHPVDIVIREYPSHLASDEVLLDHLRWHHPDLYLIVAGNLDEAIGYRPFAEAMYQEWRERFQPGPLPSRTTLEHIRQDLVRKILTGVELGAAADDVRRRVHTLVANAVRRVLGANERVGQGTRWERAEVHQRLLRGDVQNNIRGWVIAQLARGGTLEEIQRTFGNHIPEDDGAVEDMVDEWWIPGAVRNVDADD